MEHNLTTPAAPAADGLAALEELAVGQVMEFDGGWVQTILAMSGIGYAATPHPIRQVQVRDQNGNVTWMRATWISSHIRWSE